MDIRDSAVVDAHTGEKLVLSLAELAMEAFYSLDRSVHITAEETIPLQGQHLLLRLPASRRWRWTSRWAR